MQRDLNQSMQPRQPSFNEDDPHENTFERSSIKKSYERDGQIEMSEIGDRQSRLDDSKAIPPHSMRSVGSRGRPSKRENQNRPVAPKVVKKVDQQRVAAVKARQTLVISLNALTAILVVIFLQVMMFVRNAVPLATGILMSTASSVTYFVMSLATLAFLFGCHEAASYMLLRYQPLVLLGYGLVILALGSVCMATDVGGASGAAEEIWKTMSTNQQEFFGGDVRQLQAAREENTLYAGIFGLVVGVLIVVQAGLVLVLRSAKNEIESQNIEWAPPSMTSRNIKRIESHEKCQFAYIKTFEDKQLAVLGLNKKKKKTKMGMAGLDETDEEQLESFDNSIEDMDYNIVDVADDQEDLADYIRQNDQRNNRLN